MEKSLTHFNLDTIKSIIGEDLQLVFHLLQISTKKLPQQIKDLKESLVGNHLKDAVSICHNLKSNFRNIGLELLGNKAEEIEQLLRRQVKEKISIELYPIVELIELEYLKAEIELVEWMDSYESVHS